jgi:hypothetical protein
MMRERKVGLNGAIKMKQDEFRRKVKQEFAKLKIYEIGGVVYATVITGYIGKFFSTHFPSRLPISNTSAVWFQYWMIGILFNAVLLVIGMMLYVWIQKNWDWAEERVREREKKGR